MKQFDILKRSLFVSCLCAAGAVNAQVIHPLAFGSQTIGGTAAPSNWYADYIGLRLEVVSPAPVAGDKGYKAANDGTSTNTSNWGTYPTVPIINKKIKMPPLGDSLGTTAPPHYMDGHVALIYRGNIEFGTKALHAQQMGAVACIIVNNVGGGPVGMAAGSDGGSVTQIPVYMISKEDGDALDAKYNDGVASDTPVISITTWGQNFTNDLGFVPGGTALSHDYAVPANQMTNNNPFPYKMIDGAFIANYGHHTATNTRVAATTTFTPNGGAATQVHTDTSAKLTTFTTLDSIYAMFSSTGEYNLPQNSQQGRYDMTYTILTDSTDDYPADNTLTNSFYTTSNIFSKGRYDFANAQPLRTIYEAFNSNGIFTWGPTYFVPNGHCSVQKIQYSLAINVAQGGDPSLTDLGTALIFKWVDGFHDSVLNIDYPMDSIMQDGELVLVSLASRGTTAADTSNSLIELTSIRDTDGIGTTLNLDSNSWYYAPIQVPAASFLGADGILNAYPRVYGRFENSTNGYMEYNNVVGLDDYRTAFYTDGAQGNSPVPVTATAFINSVDSFNYNNSKGIIPQVALITGPFEAGVKTVKASFATVKLFPNPAVNSITVSVALQQPAKKVTYDIIDGLGRFVSRETVYNIQKEDHVLNTSKLAPGNYYMILNADNNTLSRKFTIVK